MQRSHFFTGDGSSSFLIHGQDESYHSRYGARTESEHIFIRNGLNEVSRPGQDIRILEIGFGTGLNALLTYVEAGKSRIKAEYTGYEPYPLNEEEFKMLNYTELPGLQEPQVFSLMHTALSGKAIAFSDTFVFRRFDKSIQESVLERDYFNLIYFDAFAPDFQPDLWQMKVFSKLYDSMAPGGILLTYSAKGEVRRTLSQAGFRVERVAGPKGKRHITRAEKPEV